VVLPQPSMPSSTRKRPRAAFGTGGTMRPGFCGRGGGGATARIVVLPAPIV
jgi:hypothetical protein